MHPDRGKRKMIVKKNAFYFVCCMFIGFSAVNGHAAPIGSGRSIVQKNFQQLVKTNGCPGCDLAGAVLTRVDLSALIFPAQIWPVPNAIWLIFPAPISEVRTSRVQISAGPTWPELI